MEDRVAVLDRYDAASRERAPVTNPLHLVDDRNRRIAGTEEVGVQGVDEAARHRARCGNEGLTGHLAAEDSLAFLIGTFTPEEVLFDLFEIEKIEEIVDCGLGHQRPFCSDAAALRRHDADGGGARERQIAQLASLRALLVD